MGHEQSIRSRATRAISILDGPVGVIDIGSNSVRLVIFEAAQRNPIALFNEKILCGIGRKIGSTGALDPEGVERAREALARFRVITAERGVSRVVAVATAAVRDAKNGAGFVEEASHLCGVPVRVLSGEEEAMLSAEGVLSGIPDADGLVGDLGGGSLELIELTGGKAGRAATLPLGPLRLMERGDGKVGLLRDVVDAELAQVPWLSKMAGKPFYAVGGAWRNLARIHMGQWNYPLHILQNYEIGAEQALRLSKVVIGLGRKSLQSMVGISRKRLDTVPYGALVLERLIAAAGLQKVIVSAYGLREGLLFDMLPPEERRRDPLIEAARELALSQSRNPRIGEELVPWIAPLFPGVPDSVKRLFAAAALLSDTHWRTHPDYRAEVAFLDVQRAQLCGITHAERAFLALCVFYRYAGAEEGGSTVAPLHPIAGDEAAERAHAMGCALRLAHTLCASASDVLPRCPVTRIERRVVLTLPRDLMALAGESVRKRLAELAEALGCTDHIETAA
jgi:exopolyphosphatase / guanosine-5'-triphosphate,3'-diphosphate pyrophosphatase